MSNPSYCAAKRNPEVWQYVKDYVKHNPAASFTKVCNATADHFDAWEWYDAGFWQPCTFICQTVEYVRGID